MSIWREVSAWDSPFAVRMEKSELPWIRPSSFHVLWPCLTRATLFAAPIAGKSGSDRRTFAFSISCKLPEHEKTPAVGLRLGLLPWRKKEHWPLLSSDDTKESIFGWPFFYSFASSKIISQPQRMVSVGFLSFMQEGRWWGRIGPARSWHVAKRNIVEAGGKFVFQWWAHWELRWEIKLERTTLLS